jgi:peptide/nickel transport system ATP-binding protein
VPSLADLPSGCAFHPRCPAASDACRAAMPELIGETRKVACYHPVDDKELVAP